MIKKGLLLLFLLTSFCCFSQKLSQNNNASFITFTIKNFGFDVDGNFSDFKIQSNFNVDDLEECFIKATIKVNSIFTDSKARDEHLLKADYFDVQNYPNIQFESEELKKINDSKYSVIGFLTIKGTKKRIETFLDIKDSEKSILI